MDKTILLVDDEPDMLEILEMRLKKSGYKVITAVTGEECLQKSEEQYPDLILLDILLPGMSGFEVARQLKAKKITIDIAREYSDEKENLNLTMKKENYIP